MGKKFRFRYCSTFVCLWQILSNYRLIRVKRFISRFTGKLYISFCFYLYLMLHACAVRFDVTEKLENFLVFLGELNLP
jgi:hypothetical protein